MPHNFAYIPVILSARGYHVPGSRVRGHQSTTPHDDSTTKAAVTAAAAAKLVHLQTMRVGMAAGLAEEPGLGGSGIAGYDTNDTHDCRAANATPHQAHAHFPPTI